MEPLPKRYHPVLSALHWLLALMLIAALAVGTLSLDKMPNSDPAKLGILRIHMMVGGLILVLMLVRLVVRLKTLHPAKATTGNALLDQLAPLMHWALYGLVFAMAGSGIALSVLAGLPAIVFDGVGTLPVNFDAFPPRMVHGLVAKLLIALIALHIAAALFHQFIKRDGLLARMGWGARY